MYKKWLEITKKYPYSSVIIAAVVGSSIGIAIEYFINKKFVWDGFGGLVVFIVVQMLLIKKVKKK